MIEYDNYDIKRRTLQHIQYQCIYKNLTHRHHTFNSVSNSFGCWLDLLLLADHTRETGLIEVYFVLLESSQWNTKWMCSWKVVVVLSKSAWYMKKTCELWPVHIAATWKRPSFYLLNMQCKETTEKLQKRNCTEAVPLYYTILRYRLTGKVS